AILVIIFAVFGLVGCGARSARSPARRDAAVAAAVRSALATDENLPMGTTIGVETHHGNVQLSGTVGSGLARLRAAQGARDVHGVSKVTNHLQVSPSVTPGDSGR